MKSDDDSSQTGFLLAGIPARFPAILTSFR